jgi:enamine deaminase RidA (YjgF/YER057c/UK114 family)
VGRKLISSGSEFERTIGYSRAVVDGDFVFVSGTTGYDYATMRIPDSVVEQAEQCFVNVERALREAGSGMKDVVRVLYILPHRDDFQACWPVCAKWLGEVRPTATMIEARLMNDAMKIEIEVTARTAGT